ncbi:NAD(P)-binding domain-containing protein, partial [Alphaproteobacteria bacterium]|nr:NAD(P)-binding domain-containing protein [Alphaproteobacteria bacterium]
MKKVGFIGLGNMGTPMVKNLLKEDYDVIGYDVDSKSVEDIIPFGIKKALNLDDIAKLCDVIITMLPN